MKVDTTSGSGLPTAVNQMTAQASHMAGTLFEEARGAMPASMWASMLLVALQTVSRDSHQIDRSRLHGEVEAGEVEAFRGDLMRAAAVALAAVRWCDELERENAVDA